MAKKPTIAPPSRVTQNTMQVVPRGQAFRPHEDVYHFLLVKPWWVFLLFACSIYFAVCVLFAWVYLLQDGAITNARAGSFEDAFFFSVETMSTVGYGSLAPGTRLAHYVMTLQAVTNIVLVALFTGITFAKFSRPTARVLFTSRAVVSMRDGVPHLMVRMANWRHNQVVEAQLRMVIIAVETTKEGDVLRRPVELKLVRERTPFFLLTFTAMHVIDESSPFANEATVEKYRRDRADLIMSFSGLDETLGQQIHARHVYSIDDIVWGAHFSNVLTMLPDGRREIDYTEFHEIVRE